MTQPHWYYKQREPLYYTDGWKYLTHRRLEHCFYNQNLPFIAPYECEWYAIVKRDGLWWLIVFPGTGWDGASMYFDYSWIMYPSLVHDILHWLIAKGVLDESANDLIDKELGDCIRYSDEPIKWRHGGNISRPLRAALVVAGTSLVDEETRKVRLMAPHTRPVKVVR